MGFKVLDQSIDTTTKEGRLLFSILASLAEFETELRAERTNEGRIAAMERGVRFGAKPKLTENQIAEMKQKRSQGVLIKEEVVLFVRPLCSPFKVDQGFILGC